MKYFLGGMITFFSLLGITFAIQFYSDATVSIDEPLEETLFVAGNTVTLNQAIDGDLFVGGQNVAIQGNVTEDVWVGGNNILISGDISDDLRVGGNAVTLSGQIAGDVMGGASSFVSSNTIGGDLMLGAEKAKITGNVSGDASIGVEELFLDAEIVGDLEFGGDTINFGPAAKIGGNLILSEQSELGDELFAGVVTGEIQRTGTMFGSVEKKIDREHGEKGDKDRKGGHGFRFMRFLALVIFGSLLLWAAPNYVKRASTTIMSSPARSFGIGLLVLILTPIVGLILLLTGVGAAVGAFLLSNYVFLLIFLALFAAVFFSDLLVTKWLSTYFPDTLMTRIITLIILSGILVVLPYGISLLLGLFTLGAGYTNDMKILKENM